LPLRSSLCTLSCPDPGPRPTPFLTFEAVLNADGSILFNYQSVNNAVVGTAGIKDSGPQGPDRLLLAFNNGPNAFVGDNHSTLITPQVTSPPVPEPNSVVLLSMGVAGALGASWWHRKQRA
jgi:hypothetical protein